MYRKCQSEFSRVERFWFNLETCFGFDLLGTWNLRLGMVSFSFPLHSFPYRAYVPLSKLNAY